MKRGKIGVNITGRRDIMTRNLSKYIAYTFSQPSIRPVLNCFNKVIYCKHHLGPLPL
jgi:hypothetical protein